MLRVVSLSFIVLPKLVKHIFVAGVVRRNIKFNVKISNFVTEALLLSPSVDKSVNSRYNRIVKEALFEFLDKVNRAI